MQDRYAGDVGDFGKFGMLRCIENAGLRVGVNWYLVGDESHNNDGKHIGYLEDDKYLGCDDALLASLNGMLGRNVRSVAELERLDLLRTRKYYHDRLTEPRLQHGTSRQEWHRRGLAAMAGCDFVFLDPDNGLLAKSVEPGSDKSIKYVFPEEILDYYDAGFSVAFYSHRTRELLNVYLKRFEKLFYVAKWNGAVIKAVSFKRGTVRDYFILLHEKHVAQVEESLAKLVKGQWGQHFEAIEIPDSTSSAVREVVREIEVETEGETQSEAEVETVTVTEAEQSSDAMCETEAVTEPEQMIKPEEQGGKCELVKHAMLAVQRYPWEQGVCAQALWEYGDMTTAVAMAHDAVLRQQPDGRLAVINENIAVTDPAANGEVVWRAYELTGDKMYREAAEKMLHFLMEKAPRTDKGIICHNEVSFHEGYSANQIWVDSIYMAPPFLAVMGELEEAVKQIEGYISYLKDGKTGLLYHIYDAGSRKSILEKLKGSGNGKFVRKKLWATGNGWALLGIGRVIDTAIEKGRKDIAERLIRYGTEILDAMLQYQLADGRFHDILDEEDSFVEGTAAMMMAAFVYRGIAGRWLSEKYRAAADKVRATMDDYVDEFGIIHEVCGCPHFDRVGTSAESMAAYLMMHAAYPVR